MCKTERRNFKKIFKTNKFIKFKFILLFFVTIIIVNCDNSHKVDIAAIKKSSERFVRQNKSISLNEKADPKNIGDYMSDTSYFFWAPKQSDTAVYWVRIVFQNDFAVYQFHGQCIYWFFTNHYYTNTDKIELLWSYKTDCLLSMDFLRKSNGVNLFPKTGEVFCEYSLLNDTIIEVKYNFPLWAEKINKMEKDSIFPKYLYLQKR